MSDYQDITGTRIKYLSSDPTLESSYEGQVWYNSATGVNKALVGIRGYSTAANLNNSVSQHAGAGLQTAALSAFGRLGGPNAARTASEEYNGSGWTTGGNASTARWDVASGGPQTSAIFYGGYGPSTRHNSTEEYNGTSFSGGGNLPEARNAMGSARLAGETAGLGSGGNPGSGNVANTVEYNGSAWSEVNAMPYSNNYAAGGGTQTSAMSFAGFTTAVTTNSVQYDGTNWTATPSLSTARESVQGAGASSEDGIMMGGYTPASPNYLTLTEAYDGTSWSAQPTLPTAVTFAGQAGTSSSAAVTFGGNSPSVLSSTFEFNNTINTITSAAFSGGGNMNTARRAMAGGAGTSTAGMVAGGYTTTNSNATEEYDGSAWANGGNLPVALYYITVAGTQTAGLAIGGGDPVVAEGIEYDGSSWTDIGNAPASVKMAARAGTQTAALLAGGNDSSNNAVAKSFTYNGSSFSNITDMPSARGSGHVGGGSQTNAVMATGSNPSGYESTSVEWNGSSWTAGGSYLVPGQSQMCSNPSGYDQLAGGGYLSATSAITNLTLGYNGTSWFTQPNISTARQQGSGFGTQTDGVFCAGTTGTATNATEEFTAETETITASTLTTS